MKKKQAKDITPADPERANRPDDDDARRDGTNRRTMAFRAGRKSARKTSGIRYGG